MAFFGQTTIPQNTAGEAQRLATGIVPRIRLIAHVGRNRAG